MRERKLTFEEATGTAPGWIHGNRREANEPMSLRKRSGNRHYRFFAAGRTWTADTGLANHRTQSERRVAGRKWKARKLIGEGRQDQLKIQPRPFRDAADQFIEWAKGEHRKKKETWKRLRTLK
jgi:hypothetical protein